MLWNHSHQWSDPRCESLDGKKYKMERAFQDRCEHPDESFIGSIEYWYGVGKVGKADIYVFEDTYGHQDVCIRTGDEGGDYISPGTVLDVMIAASKHPDLVAYRAAAALIDELFFIRFTKRPKLKGAAT